MSRIRENEEKSSQNTESQNQDSTTATDGTDNRHLSELKTQMQFPEQVTALKDTIPAKRR